MSAKSRNKKRTADLSGEVVIKITPIAEPCYTKKVKHAGPDQVPTKGSDGSPLRPYQCTYCGWWHATSSGPVKWHSAERGEVRA